MTEEAKKEGMRELGRLAKMSPAAADYHVTRTYLEWLVALPWTKVSEIKVDIQKAKEVLDEDHWDLEKVKERILDYLAVLQLKPQLKGPILCFVGPAGSRQDLAGQVDCAGAGPEILTACRWAASTTRPKSAATGALISGRCRARSFRACAGQKREIRFSCSTKWIRSGAISAAIPSSALLEVLDPEQNSHFRDNYLDVQFDLSKVLFICTANVLDTVPPPLLDRMEVLELQGYSEEEKIQIAVRHLITKQTDEHGIKSPDQIEFTRPALAHIIRHYTREAGVRNLEREIATVCRKQARKIAEGATEKLLVTPDNLRDYLGIPRFRLETEVVERTRQPGVVVGLAWTPTGGDVLFVEANAMKGGKGFTMTGHVGQVMQESMQAALAWVRSHAVDYGIDADFFQSKDIHFHVPSGAIPKDGPSAGVTMVTALVSALTRRPVKPRVAMTGEITLSGQVLPVGGIKEKTLAAKRSGVLEVILPADNEPNVHEDLDAEMLEGLTLHYVKSIREAVDWALEKEPVAVESGEPAHDVALTPVAVGTPN